MKKKKVFAVIFCMVLTVASLASMSMAAFAADMRVTVDNIEYELVGRVPEQEYHIKAGKRASGDVVIPAEIDGIPVTEILAAAFSENYRITSVTVGDNIIRIHNDAFAYCNDLVSVTFGTNVEVIGQRVFDSCHALRTITLNDKLADIQEQAFSNCLCLHSITMGMGLKTIGENAFEECKVLQTVTLPDGVSLEGTGVGEEARVSLNKTLEAEFPEMVAQRDAMQAELDAFNNRIETVREFLKSGEYNTGSAFGNGNYTIIIVCAILVAAVMIVGIVISRKKCIQSSGS